MFPPSIQKLIDIFSKFPTVGPRTAERFVFYLLKQPQEEIDQLLLCVSQLKNQIKLCANCYNGFESSAASDLCAICSDKSRDQSLVCLVATETDLEAMEKTKKYKGLYFVLGGYVKNIRVKELEKRIQSSPEIKEIILALSANTPGETTALTLERHLKSSGKKITRLGRGLPLGGELEYADEETLSSALENRK